MKEIGTNTSKVVSPVNNLISCSLTDTVYKSSLFMNDKSRLLYMKDQQEYQMY